MQTHPDNYGQGLEVDDGAIRDSLDDVWLSRILFLRAYQDVIAFKPHRKNVNRLIRRSLVRFTSLEAEATVVQGALNLTDIRKQFTAAQPSVEVATNVVDRVKLALDMG